MNKTQTTLVSRLVNRGPYMTGSYKLGWTITEPRHSNPYMALQKLNEINQAYGLADKYPEIFAVNSVSYKLLNLYLLNDLKAREILKQYEGRFT